MLNGLDLFSGIGGISLALESWVRPVAYCEVDTFCRNVLLSRMVARQLTVAPIWDDITTLHADHLGVQVDIIYGGFPCQDISLAGNGGGLDGERSGLFWEIARLVREVSPRFVFLENVAAIRTRGLRQVVGAFEQLGYDCRWSCLSAADVGAAHKRDRWWLLARRRRDIADAECMQLRKQSGRGGGPHREGRSFPADPGETRPTPHTDGEGKLQSAGAFITEWRWSGDLDLEAPGEDGRIIEPCLGGTLHGVPAGVDGRRSLGSSSGERLKSLGNAVVPAQAREAFRRLMGSRNA